MRLGDTEYPSLRGKVSDEEWRARVELAALYRLVPLMGWDDLSITHCSARVPGKPHYLFNPMGFLFEEITASSLIKITLEGEVLSETPFEITLGGWYPMKAVHAAREDANFVIHTHDTYGIALSARKEKLQPVSQGAGFVIADKIAYHDYDGVETYEDRIVGLQKSLGDANRLILHNHGLLTVGRTARQAFQRMHGLNKACLVQLLAGRSEELIHLPESILAGFPAEITRAQGNNPWPGMLRKLDRLDPSYKD
ncbi:MAG TPA: class II aldolase/adducin family protein [Rhizomicrobium sp.]|jgi:ribulose-5-phosphate 4-epimerase/fuculose-1-phosphate aldolase